MAAHTFQVDYVDRHDNFVELVGTLIGTTSYDTGGSVLNLASIGLTQLDEMFYLTDQAPPYLEPVLAGSPTAPKIKLRGLLGVEAPAAFDASALVAVRLRLRGKN